VIGLIFVSFVALALVCFIISLWRKWIREFERHQAYQLDFLVARER